LNQRIKSEQLTQRRMIRKRQRIGREQAGFLKVVNTLSDEYEREVHEQRVRARKHLLERQLHAHPNNGDAHRHNHNCAGNEAAENGTHACVERKRLVKKDGLEPLAIDGGKRQRRHRYA
jgi:hypothetical protein